MSGTRILTNWQPSRLDRKTIESEIEILIVRIFGHFGGTCTIRTPDCRLSDNVREFHVDALDSAMIIWSSNSTTEIRYHNGRMFQSEDGDVIWVDHSEVLHRTPQVVKPNRWLVRIANPFLLTSLDNGRRYWHLNV